MIRNMPIQTKISEGEMKRAKAICEKQGFTISSLLRHGMYLALKKYEGEENGKPA